MERVESTFIFLGSSMVHIPIPGCATMLPLLLGDAYRPGLAWGKLVNAGLNSTRSALPWPYLGDGRANPAYVQEVEGRMCSERMRERIFSQELATSGLGSGIYTNRNNSEPWMESSTAWGFPD